MEIKQTSNQINFELRSHLTSHLYGKAENLLKFYKTNRESIPVIIIVVKNGRKREVRTELTWDNIEITQLKEDKFGNVFELNLSEINIK